MISHAHVWLLMILQISLFIYFNLGLRLVICWCEPIQALIEMNQQTCLQKQQQPDVDIADHAQLWEG